MTTGAALMQWDDWNKAHPVDYLSQTLNQAERGYNVYNKELLAVLCTVMKHLFFPFITYILHIM